MAIDISKRPDNNIRRVAIPQKRQPGYSENLIAAVTLIAIAADCIGIAFSGFINIVLYIILRFIGQTSVPLACYLIAQNYIHSKNVRKTAVILAVSAIISHIPYVYMSTGSFALLNRTSIMFPLFMGFSALMVRDMTGIDSNVKSVVMLLVCMISAVGYGGWASAAWIYIFGSNFSKKMKIKYFFIAGMAALIINLIFNLKSGFWYTVIYQLGIFLAVPFISKHSFYNGKYTDKCFYYILYPAILLLIAIIKKII